MIKTQFKIDYKLDNDDIHSLKEIDSSVFANKEIYIYYGMVEIFGILDVIINDQHVFQISEEGFEILKSEKNLGYTSKSSKIGFNYANLFAWFWDLNEIAYKFINGEQKGNIQLEGNDLDFDIEIKEDILLITFQKGHSHWLSPHLIYNIKNEQIPLNLFINETIKKSDKFLTELLHINSAIKNNEEYLNIIDLLNKLKSVS